MNLSGHYYLGQFCDKLLNDKPAERLARIHRVELLKDMRIVDWDLHVHLKHEFLVFSLSYNGEESLLYFEHWWGDDSEVPIAHRSAEELDELMFYKPGDSEEIGRREWTTSVLEVYIDMTHAGTRFTLYYLANILRKYQNDHPMYRLFGANCWAWSRAIILDIIKPPRRIERVTMANKDPDITPDQLKIYLMTEYGAWGGLLLRCVGESWSLSCPFLGSVFIIPKF
jgi:hypothetical protein